MALFTIDAERGAPSYTSYSEHEKETLLSQLGSFTPVQRTLFHALCDTHKPEIPYRKFSEKMGMLVKNVQAELEALVTHLNRNKMGLFRCSYSDSERKIESIILTEPGDIWFSIYSLTELCNTLIHGSAPTLPTLSLLKEEKLEIPDSFVTRVDLKQISKTYIQETVQSNAIAAVPMSSGETLFFVSSSLNSFIQLCIAVIRDVTGYGDILSELARFKNISLNEIKQQLGTKAPLAWLEITETIDSYAKKRGEKKEIQVRDGFFEAAELLRFYLANEVREAKEKKQEERELSADFQAILLRLKGEFKTPVPQATMDTILGGLKKKHGENFPEVSARFYSHYTKPEEKSALAAVIQAAGHYIHRDNSYRYIALRIREAGRKLHEEYLLTMIGQLKSNNREGNLLFHSLDNFDEDILHRIKAEDSFLSAVFNKPRIFAESIIHTAKTEKNIQDVNKIRTILEHYFEPGTMRFRPAHQVFQLNIYTIYSQAFDKLPVLRQFWLKLTGRAKAWNETYETFRNRGINQGSASFSSAEKELLSQGRGTEPSRGNRDRPETPGVRSKKTEAPGVSYRKSKKKKKSAYSSREREKAWDDFRSTLKK